VRTLPYSSEACVNGDIQLITKCVEKQQSVYIYAEQHANKFVFNFRDDFSGPDRTVGPAYVCGE